MQDAKEPQRRPPPKTRHTPRPARPPGEPTLVHDQRQARFGGSPSQPFRLVILRGPGKGAELPLTQSPTTLGRGSDNLLAIPDLSVSRHHARLERQGESWVLHDQGSGNGTRVNGDAVDQIPLRQGDEIELGDTCLQFIRGDAARAQDEAGRTAITRGADAGTLRRRAPAWVAIGVALVASLGAGAVGLMQRERAADGAGPADGGRRGVARARLEEGDALLEQGRRAEGSDELQIGSQLDARDPGIARARGKENAEVPRAQALAAPRASLDVQRASGGPKQIASARGPAGGGAVVRRPIPSRSAPPGTAAKPDPGDGAAQVRLAPEASGDGPRPQEAAQLRAAAGAGGGKTTGPTTAAEPRIREIYLRAYLAKDEDPEAARSDFERVAAALPASDEMARKAKRWLDKLEGKSAKEE